MNAVSHKPDKIMEQELNYVQVKFKTDGSSARGESRGPVGFYVVLITDCVC